jgi:RNA polymerase sigma-70 factor, ECF subfamily
VAREDAFRRAAAAWPGVEVDQDELEREIAARGGDASADEIYVALACARGDRRAIEAFERRYFAPIAAALARLSLGADDVAEVEQLLRRRLFVGVGGAPPKILAYAGMGRLEGLIRVAAVRAGLSIVREQRRDVADGDWLEGVQASTDDPRLAHLKSRHREEFKRAFEEAIAELDDRDRSVLKLHVLERLAIDDIGAVYAVHRATAARWVAGARERLGKSVRRRLIARWELGGAELAGVASLIESQLTLSLDRLLASAGAGEAM